MGLVCWRQPSRSGPRPVLAELKTRGSWGTGAEQGCEPPAPGQGTMRWPQGGPLPRSPAVLPPGCGSNAQGSRRRRCPGRRPRGRPGFYRCRRSGEGREAKKRWPRRGTAHVSPPMSSPDLSCCADSRSRCPRSCPRTWFRCRWRTWAGRNTAGSDRQLALRDACSHARPKGHPPRGIPTSTGCPAPRDTRPRGTTSPRTPTSRDVQLQDTHSQGTPSPKDADPKGHPSPGDTHPSVTSPAMPGPPMPPPYRVLCRDMVAHQHHAVASPGGTMAGRETER